MLEVGYRRENLIFQAIGCLALAAGGVWFARLDTGYFQLTLLGWLMAAAMPVVAIALVRRGFVGSLALREVRDGLEIRTLYAAQDFAWSGLQSVHRETLQQSSAFGLIKQTIAGYLVFTGRNRSGEEVTIKLHEDLLDWPKKSLSELQDEVVDRWTRSQTDRQYAAPAPPPARTPVSPVVPTFGRRLV